MGKSRKNGYIWRDISTHTYTLGHNYIDYAWEQTDFPDFHSIGFGMPGGKWGLSGGGSLIADYFGNIYFGVSVGGGIGGSLAYTEGYIASDFTEDVLFGANRRITDEGLLKQRMVGYCSSGSVSFIRGFSVGVCPYDAGFSGSSGMVLFSAGLSAGVSIEGNGVLSTGQKDPSLGWEWAFTYRRTGWTREMVESKALLQSGICQ